MNLGTKTIGEKEGRVKVQVEVSATFLKIYNNVNVSAIVIQKLKYKLNPLKTTMPTLNMLSMAFKLVENNLSPTQRSRSQVKEK